MGLINWNWLRRDTRPPKRRESAPPLPIPKNYDRNGNRPEYKQAFNEFKLRGSLYNQMIIREENEESASQSTASQSTNTATDQSGANGAQQQDQPKPGTTKQHSLPNQMSSSVFSGPSNRRTNTPNSTMAVNENNNSIYVNEIAEFEGNCVNDISFGATNQSPPKAFYRDNSKPFSPHGQPPVNVQAGPSSSSSAVAAQQTFAKLEESRQRARNNLMSFIRPNTRAANSSNSSGAYRQYDLDSISSVGEGGAASKNSNGQDITDDVYQEIANVFQDIAQRTGPHDQSNTQNSPARPTFDGEISGIGPLSAFTSFRRCEGVVDENFAFLNDTEWRNCIVDESESTDAVNLGDINVRVTDLDESTEAMSEHDISGPERGDVESSPEIDSMEQLSQNIDAATSPQANKHPIYVLECKAKDIQPKSSVLRNTIPTPFQLSTGSFRKTTVTLKKCCPRGTAAMRLVEEAIERDFEILSKVKHSNIVILMAACFNRKLMSHMTLVMEPVDYTLHFLLHQMDKSFTLIDSITIVHQISSAALYLQECGYIHSNISSHNVLYRERPFSVKLSSFELATDIDSTAVRDEIENLYPQFRASQFGECASAQPAIGLEENINDLKNQYMELSKRPSNSPSKRDTDYMDTPSKYLVYDSTYRQHLSLSNLTAPELLAIDQRFVFPTPRTDVYSLCLLLWELLNQCVPFAVYNRTDLERMIAAKKLNLPFFERERCYFFMDVFGAGLEIEPENRELDLPQFIEQLDSIELEIITGGEDVPDECSDSDEESLDHDYENYPQDEQSEHFDDTVISSVSSDPVQMNGDHVNTLNSLVLSPSMLGFDKTLKESERTSTKKLRNKQRGNHIGQRICELFPAVEETTEGAASTDKESSSSFVGLNVTFLEMSDDISRHVFDDIEEDEQLSSNLAELAEDICRNVLNESEESESIENQPKAVHGKSMPETSTKRDLNAVPTVVGYSVKRLNHSKTHGNILETPVAVVAKKLFNFSPNETDSERQMPDTPIARQNYIRRNAWLSSDQKPDTSNMDNEAERMTNGNNKEAGPSGVNKRVNVSVRIVHNKMTPEKPTPVTKIQPTQVDEGRPSVLSKIQFFNSTSETIKSGLPLSNGKRLAVPVKADEVVSVNQTSKTAVPLSNGKHPVTQARAEVVSNSNWGPIELDKVVNDRVVAPEKNESAVHIVRNGTSTNERREIINELTNAVHNLQKGSVDQPQKKQLFENKLWKRELDICNRSLNSSDASNGSKIVAPKYRSVRDTILKFEKRDQVTRSQSTSNASTELLKTSPKPISLSQSNHRVKQSESPTMIERTVYSERIVSGINISPLDNPLFDKFGSQKVATRVSLRQVRQTSSDVGVTNRRQMSGKTDAHHTICGSEVELLTLNASNFNSSGVGPSSSAVTKYVCFECASRMSSDELKALTYEPLNTSNDGNVGLLQESLMRRCQAQVKTQDTRSIEDLYIDDDFLHELGANMELQSNCSDLLDFDMLSCGLFNSNYEEAAQNRR